MSLPATCKCGRSYQVRDDFAGQQVQCPTCGLMMDVPVTAPAKTAPVPRSPMSNRRRLFIALAVNLGALVLGVLALVVLFLMEGRSSGLSSPTSTPAATRTAAPPAAPTSDSPSSTPKASAEAAH